ncbi:MAG: hypothetical protein LQ349_001199 [Xanthoria aureola]|nr:MAG: hypothetical protein LQ349_001199 [Xanthoria aureola]
MSNTAAVIPEAKARLQVQDRPIPQPQGSEVLVKNGAIATNPVDWKIQDYATFINEYPNVLGSDLSGTIESIGPEVKRFKKGDRVTGFADVIVNQNLDHGAFQQYTLLNDNVTAKIPDSMSFEEGAILPMAIATTGVGIFLNLGIPRPTGTEKQSGGFLVWGASSSVGSAAVQIARSLGYTVYAVASPNHHSKTREYGASHVFDYNDSNVLTNITNAAKGDGKTIRLAYDAISENGTSEQVASVLEQQGGGKLVITLPFPETAKKPDNVEISATFAARINTDSKEFGAWLFNEFLERSLADKTFVPSPAIEKVEGGIASVQKALDLHRKGLSGKKLVVPLS